MSRRRRDSILYALTMALIVIVLIAMVVRIVIPRVLSADRKAREAILKNNLRDIRNGIVRFEADCGDYPAILEDLMVQPAKDSKGGRGISLDVTRWRGPYVAVIEVALMAAQPTRHLFTDPFTHASHWKYDPKTGSVHSASTMASPFNGEKYSEW